MAATMLLAITGTIITVPIMAMLMTLTILGWIMNHIMLHPLRRTMMIVIAGLITILPISPIMLSMVLHRYCRHRAHR